jgi:hypothetical protein
LISRSRFGAGPLYVLLALASFALAGWALARVLGTVSDPARFVVWFAGAIVAHDLVLFPLYAAMLAIAGRAIADGEPRRLRLAALNHLRVPVALSAILLLVWFPLISRKSERGYMSASGMSTDVYFQRWLLLSAVLLLGSALILAVRVRGLRP